MLVSSTSMKAAMATTTAITHGFTLGRQGRGGVAPLLAGISGRELAGLSVSSGIFEWLFLDVRPTSNVSDQRHTGHPPAPRIERRWELFDRLFCLQPTRPAFPLSDTQDRTRRVTNHSVGEVSQPSQGAGLGAPPDHNHIRLQPACRLGQRVFNRADGDTNQRVRSNGPLQFLDAAQGSLPFLGLQALFEVQLNG